MRRGDAGAMVALIGGFTLWMALTPTHLLYVKPSMTRWLILSGAILVTIGVLVVVLGRLEARRSAALVPAGAAGDGLDHDGGHAHGGEHAADGDKGHHHHATRIGWLLALPLCVAVAVGTNPLGSYAAGRQNSQRVLPPGQFDLASYLRAGSFAGQSPALRNIDFVRASQDAEQRDLLGEHSVKLTGFVVDDPDGLGHDFLLTRFMIACCAADALAVQVEVPVDRGSVPPEETWMEVEGTLDLRRSPEPGTSLDPPVLTVTSMHEVDEPDEYYEYP